MTLQNIIHLYQYALNDFIIGMISNTNATDSIVIIRSRSFLAHMCSQNTYVNITVAIKDSYFGREIILMAQISLVCPVP